MLMEYYQRLIKRDGIGVCLMASIIHVSCFSFLVLMAAYIVGIFMNTEYYEMYIYFSIFGSICLSIVFITSCVGLVRWHNLLLFSVISLLLSVLLASLIGALRLVLLPSMGVTIDGYIDDIYHAAIFIVPSMGVMYPIVVALRIFEINKNR